MSCQSRETDDRFFVVISIYASSALVRGNIGMVDAMRCFRRFAGAWSLESSVSGSLGISVRLGPWLRSLLLGLLMVACRAATRPATSLGGIVFASVIQEHAVMHQDISVLQLESLSAQNFTRDPAKVTA